MTLVYLTIAWIGGILLARLLWSLGAIDCATPGWLFAALAGVAALLWALLGRYFASIRKLAVRAPTPATGGIGAASAGFSDRYFAPGPSSVKGGAPISTLPDRQSGQGVAPTVGLMLIFLVLGAWRYQAHPYAACPAPNDLAFYNGDDQRAVWVTAEGVVVGYPDVRDVQTLYRLRVEALTVEGTQHPAHGDLLVQTARFPAYGYGDRLRVTGQLQTPPVLDDFDYRAYLAQRGIHSLMRRARVERVAGGQGNPFWAVLYGLKTRGTALLNRVLPEPAAALANGMLLGIESGIPPDVDEAFKATGTTHVIVISGSNIALLSGVLIAGLSRLLGKRRAAFPAIAGIALYVLLVGADAAALRAGLMGILYVFAIYLGRQSTAYVALCASAFFMTLFNPLTLWDIGFQLSFMATLGLILFTDAIAGRFEQFLTRRLAQEQARRVMSVLNDALIVTLAAQVTTLPVIVYYFGRVSPISLVTNFLILPAQPPIMTGGMATLVAGLAWEPLGRALALIPWLFLTYTTAVVRLTAAVPLASVETGALGRAAALLYCAMLFGMLGWRQLQRRGWVTMPARRAIGWAVALAAPLWLAASVLGARPDGKLHLWFVSGEDSEAALIVTPGGQQIWAWDGRGGAATGEAGAALAAATRPLLRGSKNRMDAVVGPDATALWPGAQILDPARLAPGAIVRLDADVTLTRLAAEDGWALAFGQFRAILPATLKPEAQAALLAAGADLRATILKAPGPATGAWPTSAFLTASAPQMVFWPEDTTYPPDAAAMLAARDAMRVPADAVVEVITDGKRLWVQQRSASGRR